MYKKVLFLHGWGGSDYPHWQSWLAGEIAKNYGCVNFLKFSNFDEPKLNVWMQELEFALDDFKPDIVICHSLANTLWFHLCNLHVIQEIQKLYLVAPPSLTCKTQELHEFFPVNLPKKLYAKNTLLVTSTNDPYMQKDEAKQLEKSLHVESYTLQNAGHINNDSGYGKWEWILSELKKDLTL